MCIKKMIIYEDDDFIAINKPSGMPSAPLFQNEEGTALNFVCKINPSVLSVLGKKKIEGGLLHRLDTATTGLLLFAKNQFTYDEIQKQQAIGLFKKEYTAICNIQEENNLTGFPEKTLQMKNFMNKVEVGNKICLKSKFRAFGPNRKEVRPVTEFSSAYAIKKNVSKKQYNTDVLIDCIKNNTINVKCFINLGFRHQVRVHLSWLGLPIIGDELYNSSYKDIPLKDNSLKFFATGLSFIHPTKKETFTLKLPSKCLTTEFF